MSTSSPQNEIHLNTSSQNIEPQALDFKKLEAKVESFKVLTSNTAFVSYIILLFIICVFVYIFKHDSLTSSDLIDIIVKTILPVLTGYMGYLFGKDNSVK